MTDDEAIVVRHLQSCVERSEKLAQMSTEEQQALLAERQIVLDVVQGFDTSSWMPADKKHLCVALEQLLQHTQAAAALLQTQVEALTQNRQQLAQGREALRGYRPDMTRSSRSVNRTA